MPENIVLSVFYTKGDDPDVTIAPLDPYGAQKQLEALSVQAMAKGQILALTAEFVDLPETPEEPPAEEPEPE